MDEVATYWASLCQQISAFESQDKTFSARAEYEVSGAKAKHEISSTRVKDNVFGAFSARDDDRVSGAEFENEVSSASRLRMKMRSLVLGLKITF